MRTPLVWGIIGAIHCVAVGSVIVIQGCGTPVGFADNDDGSGMNMPPTYVDDQEQVIYAPPSADVIMPPPIRYTPRPVGDKLAKSWPEETSIYTIKSGDTLSGIAKKFGVSVSDISRLNGITDPHKIRLGHRLVIPAKSGVSKVGPTSKRPAHRPPIAPVEILGAGNKYVVASGDCLSIIASRFDTSVKALKRANRLTSDRIRVGQTLVVPDGAGGSSSAEDPDVFEMRTPDADIPDALADDMEFEDEDEEAVAEPEEELSFETEVEETTRADVPIPAKAVNYRKRIVEEGEDLYSIAMQWGMDIDDLKAANDLTDTKLVPGMELRIPIFE